MFTVNRNPTTAELRGFGWAMLVGFGVLGAAVWMIAWWRGTIPSIAEWSGAKSQIAAVVLWALGAGLCVLGLAAPGPARPVYVVWMTVASAIGVVMTTVLLTVLFIVFLPPFSLIVRLGDPLRKRLKRDGSYWEEYPKYEPTLERMRRPF